MITSLIISSFLKKPFYNKKINNKGNVDFKNYINLLFLKFKGKLIKYKITINKKDENVSIFWYKASFYKGEIIDGNLIDSKIFNIQKKDKDNFFINVSDYSNIVKLINSSKNHQELIFYVNSNKKIINNNIYIIDYLKTIFFDIFRI